MGLCLLGAVSRSSAEGTKTINQAIKQSIKQSPSFLTTISLPGYVIIFEPNCTTYRNNAPKPSRY
jgi:hypothetical protein